MALGIRLRLWRTGLWARCLRVLTEMTGSSRLQELLLQLDDDLLLSGEAAAADLGITPRPFLAGGLEDLGGHLAFR